LKLFIIYIEIDTPYINPSKCQRSTPVVSVTPLTSLDSKTFETPRRPFEKEKLINE